MLEIEEFVEILKRLIVELLSTKSVLSTVGNIPPNAHPIIDRCTSKIHEIARQAGLRIGLTSSASDGFGPSAVRQGMKAMS